MRRVTLSLLEKVDVGGLANFSLTRTFWHPGSKGVLRQDEGNQTEGKDWTSSSAESQLVEQRYNESLKGALQMPHILTRASALLRLPPDGDELFVLSLHTIC
jgi:hypothetical protein